MAQHELLVALRSYAAELLGVRGLPGMALAITDRDRLIASETFGYRDLAAGAPIDPTTLFALGSIGKTFTSVLLLQLYEEGLVDLEAPVTRYLPWFEVRSQYEPIAIHHLLTHRAGLISGSDASADSRFDAWALRETETGFPPGTRFSYSNVGFRVLGYAIERVTGRPYRELLQERILDPLGLSATRAAITNEIRASLAIGYERLHDDRPPRRADPWAPAPWVETATADGCLAGTADDLSVFLRSLMGHDRRLLTPESFALMLPGDPREGEWAYGFGLEARTRGGHLEIRHGGSMPGFGSIMFADAGAGLGVVVLLNGPDEGDLTEEVAETVLTALRSGLAPPPVPDPLAVADAADYAGTYAGEDRTIELRAEGSRLLLVHDSGSTPLERRSDEQFIVDHPGLAVYLLGFTRADTHVVEATYGPERLRRAGAGTLLNPSPPEHWSTFVGQYRSYSPWLPNFRVAARGDSLLLVYPWGPEEQLTELASPGDFRLGEDWSPERLRFDAIVEGKALRANLSGCDYYRLPD